MAYYIEFGERLQEEVNALNSDFGPVSVNFSEEF